MLLEGMLLDDVLLGDVLLGDVLPDVGVLLGVSSAFLLAALDHTWALVLTSFFVSSASSSLSFFLPFFLALHGFLFRFFRFAFASFLSF